MERSVRELVRFGVMGAVLIWAVTLLFVMWGGWQVLLGWRMMSEVIWILLGVGFVRNYRRWVEDGDVWLVVRDFGIVSLVVVVSWWVLLMGTLLLISMKSAGVVGSELQEMARSVVSVGGLRVFFYWIQEGARLLIVGLVPVLGWRWGKRGLGV